MSILQALQVGTLMESPNRVTDTNAHGILLHHWGEAHTVYSLIPKHVTVQETTEFPLLTNGSLDMTKDTGIRKTATARKFLNLPLFVHRRDNSVVDMSTWYLDEAPMTVMVQ